MKHITATEQFNDMIKNKPAFLVYFSHDGCSVCHAIKPKLLNIIDKQFPLLRVVDVDVKKEPQLPAQLSVFAVPTIICFVQGHESFRVSRHFTMDEICSKIDRFYTLLFGADETSYE